MMLANDARPELRAQEVSVAEICRSLPGQWSRSTVQAVLDGSYRSMHSEKARFIRGFTEGYLYPERFDS